MTIGALDHYAMVSQKTADTSWHPSHVALDAVGAKFVRDIEPGEIVIFNHDGIRSIKDHCNKNPKSICIFEYIYFARPDSKIDGISVHRARVEAGRALGD